MSNSPLPYSNPIYDPQSDAADVRAVLPVEDAGMVPESSLLQLLETVSTRPRSPVGPRRQPNQVAASSEEGPRVKALCTLWDASVHPPSARFLCSARAVDILCSCLDTAYASDRVVETACGTLANLLLLCPDQVDRLVARRNVEAILAVFTSCSDPVALAEAFKVCECAVPNSAVRLVWLRLIDHSSALWPYVLFVLENSLDPTLIERAARFLSRVLSTAIDHEDTNGVQDMGATNAILSSLLSQRLISVLLDRIDELNRDQAYAALSQLLAVLAAISTPLVGATRDLVWKDISAAVPVLRVLISRTNSTFASRDAVRATALVCRILADVADEERTRNTDRMDTSTLLDLLTCVLLPELADEFEPDLVVRVIHCVVARVERSVAQGKADMVQAAVSYCAARREQLKDAIRRYRSACAQLPDITESKGASVAVFADQLTTRVHRIIDAVPDQPTTEYRPSGAALT